MKNSARVLFCFQVYRGSWNTLLTHFLWSPRPSSPLHSYAHPFAVFLRTPDWHPVIVRCWIIPSNGICLMKMDSGSVFCWKCHSRFSGDFVRFSVYLSVVRFCQFFSFSLVSIFVLYNVRAIARMICESADRLLDCIVFCDIFFPFQWNDSCRRAIDCLSLETHIAHISLILLFTIFSVHCLLTGDDSDDNDDDDRQLHVT